MARKTHVINGYTVVASRWMEDAQAFAILGHRALDEGHEYVTAWVDSLDATSWASGDYTTDYSQVTRAYQLMIAG